MTLKVYNIAVELITKAYEVALPIAIFYFIADLCVGTFLRAAFGGRLWFKS